MGFGKVLRTLRTTAGLSLRELARDLEVSPTYLSLIENDKSPPPIEEKIYRLEGRLGVPRGSLLSFTDRHSQRVGERLLENPEAERFFENASKHKLTPSDFDLLSLLVQQGGRAALHRALQRELEYLAAAVPDNGGQSSSSSAASLSASSLLGKNFLFTTLESQTWIDLFEQASAIIANKYPMFSAELICDALKRREKAASTAIGDGLAVPHTMLKGLKERIVLLAKIPKGVAFETPDKNPVTIAFIILGPEDGQAYHVYLLARIARFFLTPGFHADLMKAEGMEDALRIINEMDDKIP